MTRSMTGYGRGECTMYNRKFTVEIKAVNHKYNDLSIKLPRVLNPYEDSIRAAVAKKASRGKIDVYINYDSASQDDIAVSVNLSLADSYYKALQNICEHISIEPDDTLSLIAKFPEVITVEKNTYNEESMNQMWETAQSALETALCGFVNMREIEGEALKADIIRKREILINHVKTIEDKAPSVAAEFEKKLRLRIEDLLNGAVADEARILQEVTIFSDKTCIDEEITRLKSHLEQLISIISEDEPVGRKLDFLIQEINREINTVGSKSNDIEITKIVIEFKSEVEKIREQVQNIE